jgi:HPt (histidine-containing phosphotransfer) domain-containing protein
MITAMADPLEELTERFKAEALERVGQIQQLLDGLAAAGDPAESCEAIREHAHKLKGAAGVFGFDEFKLRAGELEEEAAAQAGAAGGATAAAAISPVFAGLAESIPG